MAEATERDLLRGRIVEAAARLLHDEGPAAVTTRAVAAAAVVQAPTIYRLFGDKDGLLEAVLEHAMATRAAAKAHAVDRAEAAGTDAVDDLRAAWFEQIAYALAHPGVFGLLSDPVRVARSPAARSGRAALEARVHRVALAGRLALGEGRATDLVQAAGIGTIQTLLAQPLESRDPDLAAAMYDAVARRILVSPPDGVDDGPAAAAVTLRAAAPALDALSPSERTLLADWLDRVIEGRGRTSAAD